MPETIDESDTRQVCTARYWRYRSLEEQEFGSLEEAYGFLYAGEARSALWPEVITGPDGRVVMTSAQISDACASGVDSASLLVWLTSRRETADA